MSREKSILIIAALLLIGSIAATRWFSSSEKEGELVVEIVAEEFQFKPAEIRVRAGTRVILKVRAIDKKHGIAFKVIPIGKPEGSPAGLQFFQPEPDWVLAKGKETTIEFVAVLPGRYEFACSVFCGMGHNGMLGRIVVEPR